MGAALTLAEAGLRPVLLEAMNYPGGCASTFRHAGHRFEAGATVFTGFREGQLFHRWLERHKLDVNYTELDPVLTLHTRDKRWPLPADKQTWVQQLAAQPGIDQVALKRFFELQTAVSDALWTILDEPALLPPLSVHSVSAHATKVGRHLTWMRWLGRSLQDVLDHVGLVDNGLLRDWMEATIRVTVQSSVAEVEAPFGLASLDFPFRGVVHIEGGIGTLGNALLDGIRNAGGEVHLSSAAWSIRSIPGGWEVTSRSGVIETPLLIANLLPAALSSLLGEPVLPRLEAQLQSSWGAVMQYLVVEAGPDGPILGHHQVVEKPGEALEHGNHVLVSVGERQEGPLGPVHTVTLSTHLHMQPDSPAHIARIDRIQARMLGMVRREFPSWKVLRSHPASPRTFARFTGRPRGIVGGLPRHVGLGQYRSAFSTAVKPGLYVVGDSIFPGQGTLATATGGQRVATRALQDMTDLLGQREAGK